MGCGNTAVVKAPLDQVWKAIRDFHDLSWAKGVWEEVDPPHRGPGAILL